MFKEYKQLVESLKTGDIILFESPMLGSRIIEFGSNSPYSHVGMIVRIEGISEPLLWESSLIDFMEDSILKTKNSGVHLLPLKKVIDYCGLHHNYLFALRRISIHFSPQMMIDLEKCFKSVDGINFPSISNFLIQYGTGRYFQNVGDSNKTFFCSELLTYTFKFIGLMSPQLVENSISPGDFSTFKPKREVRLLNNVFFKLEEFFIADGQIYKTHSILVQFKLFMKRVWSKIKLFFK